MREAVSTDDGGLWPWAALVLPFPGQGFDDEALELVTAGTVQELWEQVSALLLRLAEGFGSPPAVYLTLDEDHDAWVALATREGLPAEALPGVPV